jgi:formylglycine-generating enzyme required for sulfatase activity
LAFIGGAILVAIMLIGGLSLLGGQVTLVETTTDPLSVQVPEMVLVPAGAFLMGSTDADTLADGDEKPQHTVTLPEYWIGKTEVTNAQFRPFVESDGYTNQAYWTEEGWEWRRIIGIRQPEYWDDPRFNRDVQPVVGVSWYEAVAYVRWLSAQTGHAFHLPSEAEWEKAARGPDGVIYPWGDTWNANRLNSGKPFPSYKLLPVGQYPAGASPYGAMDMAGNVREWCATKWGKDYPYRVEDEWTEAYLAGGSDVRRVLRGGAWWSDEKSVRGATRTHSDLYHRYIFDGLRVASYAPLPGSEP